MASPTAIVGTEGAKLKEVYDELSQDPKRYSALDAMTILGKARCSRLLFISKLSEAASNTDVEKDFSAKIGNFNKHGENAEQTALLTEVTDFAVEDILITGLMYFVGPFQVHFLEGPTESLHYILQNVNKDLISQTKVLYMTECHKTRITHTYQSFYGTAKAGQQIPEDSKPAKRTFGVYQKLVNLHCLSDEHDQDFYRSNADAFPHLEDLTKLHDISTNPDAFTLEEYVDFYCVGTYCDNDFLNSEKTWPVAPPLRYYEED